MAASESYRVAVWPNGRRFAAKLFPAKTVFRTTDDRLMALVAVLPVTTVTSVT
jgi:hypothetical protein